MVPVTDEAVEKNDFEVAFPQFHVRNDVVMAAEQRCGHPVAEGFLENEHVAPTLLELIQVWKSKTLVRAKPLGKVSIELLNEIQVATVKLLQFCENYRPAFYGTWNRGSRFISARRPFAQDQDQLEYEVDSDEEWEEDLDEEGDECLSDEEDLEEEDMDAAMDEEDVSETLRHLYDKCCRMVGWCHTDICLMMKASMMTSKVAPKVSRELPYPRKRRLPLNIPAKYIESTSWYD